MSVVHLHLVLNHVPVIGMLFVLVILGVATWRADSAGAKLGLAFMVGLAAITGLVFMTGEPAEEAVEKVAGISDALIHPHEEAAEVALIATVIAGALAFVALVWFRRRALPRWVMGGALVVTLGASSLLGWAANLGGQIRHTEIGSNAAVSRGADDDHEKRR